MIEELWREWLASWRRMQQIATDRGWNVRKLRHFPPASVAELAALERRHGLEFPPQLREALTRCAARVEFGWDIPSGETADDGRRFPSASTFIDCVWSLSEIEGAIANFSNWKRRLAQKEISEAPNNPEMWESQFPFATLANGDMLTIDVSRADGQQPVRYFSHELEGLHYHAIAPDFFSFVSLLAKLGWAGTEQDSWFGFLGEEVSGAHYFDLETPVAKDWLAWLTRDPSDVAADEPPPPVVGKTMADQELLQAARANSLAGVKAALTDGARPDAVWRSNWLGDRDRGGEEFATALVYAVRHDNIEMLDLLHAHGAAVNTRHLAMNDAVIFSEAATLEWLVAHGARIDGWKFGFEWPLRTLIAQQDNTSHIVALRDRLAGQGRTADEIDWRAPRPLGRREYLRRLEFLLELRPDLRRIDGNGMTVLMRAGLETAERLLAHGAEVDLRNRDGETALHNCGPKKARLFVERGADINAMRSGATDNYAPVRATVLQWHVMRSYQRDPTMIDTLLELGADPMMRDGDGRSILFYCNQIDDFERFRALGLDPHERASDGATLLHTLAGSWRVREPLFDHLVGLGLDLNAWDDKGRTVLHIVAALEVTSPADIEKLIAMGADKSLRDQARKRAFDRAPKSRGALRKLLE